jgi:hypothetical protein
MVEIVFMHRPRLRVADLLQHCIGECATTLGLERQVAGSEFDTGNDLVGGQLL